MISSRIVLAGSHTPGIVVDGAKFDGVDDRVSRGGALSSVSDGKTGIASWWMLGDYNSVKSAKVLTMDNGAGVTFGLGSKATGTGATGGRVAFPNAAGTQVLFINFGGIGQAAAWAHCLFAWDLGAGVAQSFLTAPGLSIFESAGSVGTLTNDNIKYSTGDWYQGYFPGATPDWGGALSELYFAPNQFLDLSLVSNRRKFITADWRPAFLGSDGSRPTGTAPAVYQRLSDGEAIANWMTNRGTGGNFSLASGPLTTASTSPSD